MKYRPFGSTGLQVSTIALGCSGFWGSRAFPEREAAALVEAALERGINLLDTGHNYSGYNAEPRLGRILGRLFARHDRARLVISSKAGTLVPAGSPVPARWRRAQKDFSPDYIEGACAQSIRNLGCGWLDVFQLHDPPAAVLDVPLLERLQSMRQRGMFRHLGICTRDAAQMQQLALAPQPFDIVLLDFNLLLPERETAIAALHKAGVGVLAGTALAQGHLLEGSLARLGGRAGPWYAARALLKPDSRRLAREARPLRQALAAIEGMSPAQAALAWVLEHPGVASCAVGTTRLAHLLEVIEAADRRLEDADWLALREAAATAALARAGSAP